MARDHNAVVLIPPLLRIPGEALAWKIRHDAMRKKGSSLMDGASNMIRKMSRKSTISCASNSSAGGSSFELGPTCSTDDYDYKGPSTRDSKEEAPPPNWTKSPEPVRIKKRPSRNAQILDSWDGGEVDDPKRRMSTQALIDTEEQV